MALLAYLALEPGPHARDSLAALFWPEADQVRSRGNLRSSLHELSRSLGPESICSSQDRVRLDAKALSVDVDDYLDGGVDCDHAHEKHLCPDCLGRAEATARAWRGGFMLGFTLSGCQDFDDWQFRWSTRLREAQVGLLSRLAGHYARSGRTAEAQVACAEWIALEPFSEEARREELVCLARLGLDARACECYEAWVRVCRDELRREPAPATRALVAVREELSPRSGSGAASATSLSVRGGRTATTALLGREAELVALVTEIQVGHGAHTLTGTGGIGKTSLARAILAIVGPGFAGGSWFVDLSSERRADAISYRVAAVLGMHESGDSPEAMSEAVVARIGASRCLLVLDNLEQIPNCGTILDTLISACPDLCVLMTSRSPVGLRGECVHELATLGQPPDGADLGSGEIARWPALELLVTRALRADPELELGEESLEACACLARRLDGLPLAIELAASLVGLLGAREALERVERHLDLAAPHTDSRPERQRSLYAVVEWSLELLPPSPRRAFACLSVFDGDFDLEAAEAVLGDGSALEAVDALVGAALLRRLHRDGRARFVYYRSICDHAGAMLAWLPQAGELRERFAREFLRRAEALAPVVRGKDQVELLCRAELDMRNYEAAMDHFVHGGKVTEALRLGGALEWIWSRLGLFASGARTLEAAIAASEPLQGTEVASLRGGCLRALGWLRFGMGAWHEAHAYYLEALSLLENSGDRRGLTRTLSDLGVSERWLGNRVGGDERCLRAVQLAQEGGDPGQLAAALVWCHGTSGGRPGDDGQKLALEEAERLGVQAAEPWIVAHSHQSLGEVCMVRGEDGEALTHFERALAGFTGLGDRWMLGWTLDGAGMADCHGGRLAEGRKSLRRALELFLELGARGDAAYILSDFGHSYLLEGDSDRADFIFGVFSAVQAELGIESVARVELRRAIDAARSRAALPWRLGLKHCCADLPGMLPEL